MNFIFDPSLVLYLPLHELDGGSFVSKDKHGHLATAAGALWTPQGRTFDGIDDKITLNDGNTGSPLNLTTSDFSLEFWVSVDVLGLSDYRSIINRGTHTVDGYYVDARESNKLRFSVDRAGASDGVDFANFFTTETWIHGICVKSGSNFLIYKNGEFFNGAAGIGNPASSTRPCRIGVYGNGTTSYMDGIIGEVRVYNRALALPEIQHNYLATKWRYQ